MMLSMVDVKMLAGLVNHGWTRIGTDYLEEIPWELWADVGEFQTVGWLCCAHSYWGVGTLCLWKSWEGMMADGDVGVPGEWLPHFVLFAALVGLFA